MKLKELAENPSLRASGQGYQYSIKVKGDRGKAKIVNGHIGAVIEILKGILKKKLMTTQELCNIRASASYHLLVEVTDEESDEAIKALLEKAGWSKRYSLSRKIEIESEIEGEKPRTWIVCREWIPERMKKLIDGVSHVCTVELVNSPQDKAAA